MELNEVIFSRRMTRDFTNTPVPAEVLERILSASLGAPSAGFTQGVDFLVLTSQKRRSDFWAASATSDWRSEERSAPLMAAPVIIVPIANPAAYVDRYTETDKAHSSLSGASASSWTVPYWLVDAAFSTMLILLAAEAEQLGALFFRHHRDENDVLADLGVPPHRVTIGALALGYKASDEVVGSLRTRERRALGDIVHREHW